MALARLPDFIVKSVNNKSALDPRRKNDCLEETDVKFGSTRVLLGIALIVLVLGGVAAALLFLNRGDREHEIAQLNTLIAHGNALYEERCAMCHDEGLSGAPSFEAVSLLDRKTIVASMATGVMQVQSAGLSPEDHEAIAAFLTKDQALAEAGVTENRCEGELNLQSPALWSRWGNNLRNTRFQPAEKAGIDAESARDLKLKWSFGFRGAARARAHPTVTPEAIFTADQHGTVYALDTETGS